MAVRVVLAEDSALLRDGVVRLLGTSDLVEVVGVCRDLSALMEAIDVERPDVVLTDIRMPPTQSDEGIQAARHIRIRYPEMGVVVLSQYVEPAFALELLDGGAGRRGYLLKERVADVDELVAALLRVDEGGTVIDPKVVDVLLAERSEPTESPLDRLSPRERDVLGAMASGKSNAAIATSLVLSERAVEKHSSSIFSKLDLSEEPDLNRRVAAVLLWLDQRPRG